MNHEMRNHWTHNVLVCIYQSLGNRDRLQEATCQCFSRMCASGGSFDTVAERTLVFIHICGGGDDLRIHTSLI